MWQEHSAIPRASSPGSGAKSSGLAFPFSLDPCPAIPTFLVLFFLYSAQALDILVLGSRPVLPVLIFIFFLGCPVSAQALTGWSKDSICNQVQSQI